MAGDRGGRRPKKGSQEWIDLLEKEARVVTMRTAGLPWDEIARREGYADHSGAYYAWLRAMHRIEQPAVEAYRNQQELRLNELLSAVWPDAMRNKSFSVQNALAIVHELTELFAVAKPSVQKTEITGDGDYPLVFTIVPPRPLELPPGEDET